MKTIVWQTADEAQKVEALKRPMQMDDVRITEDVAAIMRDVRFGGDSALLELSRKFDKAEWSGKCVAEAEIKAAPQLIDAKLRAAIEQAQANITAFHRREIPEGTTVETMPGVQCSLIWRPIEIVGIYIPGGTAPLFSTVLMQAIPAKLAGCRRIVLCTPPQAGGTIHPAVLAAAALCGIDEIYALGGAHAIAAMAYGTATIPKVDKICGPGNAFVTAAKQLAAQDPDGAPIDMPAGPSEVMVIASPPANAAWVAADLLAQAEHDVLAQAILVTTDARFASSVATEVAKQLSTLPRRAIAEKSISSSRIIITPDMKAALAVANRYAAEHLIIHGDDAETYLSQIQHAGSVFLGSLTPESAGDYASGTNHVLPTSGYARGYSGLTVMSFMKSMTVQKISKIGLENLGPAIIVMAEAEGLTAHAEAVRVRMEEKA